MSTAGGAPKEVAHASYHDDKIDVLRKWLDAGGDPNAFNVMDAKARMSGALPQTLLMNAACGAPENMKLLISRGGDVNKRDAMGNSPLHWAMQLPLTTAKCIHVLVDAGADPNATDLYLGTTPLMKTCGMTPMEVLVALLSRGAAVDAKDEAFCNSAEHLLGLIDPQHSVYARAGFQPLDEFEMPSADEVLDIKAKIALLERVSLAGGWRPYVLQSHYALLSLRKLLAAHPPRHELLPTTPLSYARLFSTVPDRAFRLILEYWV